MERDLDDKEDCEIPPKRVRVSQKCIIHCTTDNEDANLVFLKNINSWNTLLRSAQIRNHLPILDIASSLGENEIPRLQYHRTCRSVFTMKRLLDDLSKSQTTDNAYTGEQIIRSTREKSNESRVYEVKCILCPKKTKYLKGTRTREELVKCTTLASDAQLRAAATRKMDKQVLAVLSRDLVAAEGHYHRSCYRLYTKIDENSDGQSTSCDVDIAYSTIEDKAYKQLFEFIRNELFNHPDLLLMSDLTSRLVAYMELQGCSDIKAATRKHIRRKLETEFGDSINIISDSKGKLIVYPDNLSRDTLVRDLLALKMELNITKSSEKDLLSLITKVALQMRADIKGQDVTDEWPPHPADLTPESAHLPSSLTHFLNAIITGDKVTAQSDRIERQINSFGQDSDPPIVKFHDRIAKLGLKTFSALTKKKKMVKAKGTEVILQADRNLFGHMVLAAQSRKLDLKDVMAHPLGPIPWALATTDGSLRKTNKAKFGKAIIQDASAAESIPKPSACIIDGMGLIQRMRGDNQTFAELARQALSLALREGAASQRIDVVFDVYQETSIKNAERCNRGARHGLQFKNIAAGHKIHQWRKFLCSPFNKTSLIKFLVETWKKTEYADVLGKKTLFATCEDSCFKITKADWEELDELKTSQEEADTRVLLHAAHAAKSGYKAVIITAEDTDILVLALGFDHVIPCLLYQKVGTQNRQKYIDISKVANKLGDDMCTALVGLHAYTGCDTISAFAGKGKIGALKIMMKENAHQQCFSTLGQSWDISPSLLQKLQSFTCAMYVPRGTSSDINSCRYNLFCAKRGEVNSSQLPPCLDCLSLHAQRANYQAGIWRRCLQCEPDVPSPINHGWNTDDDGNLGIQWMTGSPAPTAVLELMKCNCIRSCDSKGCPCIANGLKCSQMCRLQSCVNQITDVEVDDVQHEFESDEGSSDDDDD